jgi:hypothetical protein
MVSGTWTAMLLADGMRLSGFAADATEVAH